MKVTLIVSACLFLNIITYAQKNVTVADKASHQIIPFANIQVKDSDLGTSSNEFGVFLLTDNMKDATLVISAIGYQLKEQSALRNDTIFLEAAPIQIPDVVVGASKILFQTKIGTYKKNKKGISFGAGNKQPWMLARYFPYDLKYRKTPYIRTITVETRSSIKDAQFMIRLYKKGVNGEPGDFLYNKPILASAKKGTNNTSINMADYDIVFPEEGLFVVMEYLAIESNKYVFIVNDEGSKKSYETFSFEPRFVSIPSDTDEASMLYQQGKWMKMPMNTSPFVGKDVQGKYNMFAVELMLAN